MHGGLRRPVVLLLIDTPNPLPDGPSRWGRPFFFPPFLTMADTPTTTTTPAPASGFGAIFSQILSKGLDTAASYANATLAIKSAEAQAKANQGPTVVVTSPTVAKAGETPKWLPWAIGGGVALLALFGLGMVFRRN